MVSLTAAATTVRRAPAAWSGVPVLASTHRAKGTRVVAMDSAKQTHYLPAILGVQAWFGSTADCVEAACTGRWQGGLT